MFPMIIIRKITYQGVENEGFFKECEMVFSRSIKD